MNRIIPTQRILPKIKGDLKYSQFQLIFKPSVCKNSTRGFFKALLVLLKKEIIRPVRFD